MAVTLTGAEGFFTREGVIIGEYNRVASLYGSALTAGFQSIWAQFASSDQSAVEGLPGVVDNYRNSGLNYQQTLVADGIKAMTLQVDRDTPLVPYTLTQALVLVIAQMKSTSQSINRPTTTGPVTANGSNLGDTTLLTSLTNQYGDPLDMVMAETVTLTCTQSVTSYQAPLSAVGESVISPNSYAWPGGSGANTSFTVYDADVDGIVTDGGFNNWSGTGNNTPDDWEIINGDAGVTIFRSAAGGMRGLDAAKITSDGAQATQLGQDITVSVNTVYCVSVYAKINSHTATGVFRIALCDNNGNVLTDDAGTNLEYTRNVNGQVTTTFGLVSAFFSTPRQLPTTVRVQYGTSTAATSGREITMSLAGVVAATQLYPGGPFVAAISGEDRTALNDSYTIAYTNSLTAQSFARGMDRLYNMRQLGVYFPSDVSPTISDSLVTN